MSSIQLYHSGHPPTRTDKQKIVDFLLEHLEQYGDKREDIEKACDYSLGAGNSPGGVILTATDGDVLAGAVVINKTGMQGYIPENILVYIATHKALRGKGIGKTLMEAAIRHTTGDIALHVEPDNPAKKLYEKLGFTNKYLEMRLKKK
jgi:ribosomal-protein-alanine N-acetyltransferase